MNKSMNMVQAHEELGGVGAHRRCKNQRNVYVKMRVVNVRTMIHSICFQYKVIRSIYILAGLQMSKGAKINSTTNFLQGKPNRLPKIMNRALLVSNQPLRFPDAGRLLTMFF